MYSDSVLFPGTEMYCDAPWEHAPEDVEAVTSGRHYLYLYGFAIYKDGFGKGHRTIFALQFEPQRAIWNFLPEHNTAT